MTHNFFLSKYKLIVFTSLVFLSCKNNITKQSPDHSILQIEQTESENLKREKSFVHSCGSGCAMSYEEIEIVTKGTLHKIKFRITMYIDEKITEEYFSIYEVNCQKGYAVSMNYEGDKENILTNSLGTVKRVFQKYANQICSNEN